MAALPEIVYSDKDIIIAVKPPGVLSEDHPGGMPALLWEMLGDPAADVRSVHRLDRAVGGLMVYARNAAAASFLIREIAERKFDKQYLCVTEGVPAETSGLLTDLLYHSARENKTYVVDRKRKGVREAILEYEVLEEKDGKALIRVQLLTGRTHQIRAQFASRKLPLLGDRRYGAKEPDSDVALWSFSLAFRHPRTKEMLSFRKLPPVQPPWTLFESCLGKSSEVLSTE